MGASAVLPTGTVTFLLTDVEGSTRMFERSADGTLWALQRHHEVLADAIERHGGVLAVEQGEGDSVVAVFPRAADAVVCAAEAQRALGAQEWPDGLDMRVRVAVHTGEGILREAGRYSGLALHRCARVRGIGHGGQVLVTATTAQLARDVLPEDLELIDLGEQRLRDLSRPERVFQLAGPGLTRSFPTLRSLDAVTTNLKVQLTSFVGREAEMHDVDVLLAASRLVTLTGSGGVGKTRLALQAVAEHAGAADGVWLADLAGLSDPDAVASFVNAAIGGREQPGRAAFDVLAERLGEGTCILVLDNCEHIIAPLARLAADLTTALPSLLVVATSREPLGVPGEVVYRVPSMALPAATAPSDQTDESDAVRLFVDRARLVRPSFVLTSEVCDAVVEICRRVDGLPLAIELAAARIRVLSPVAIAQGLDDRFRLLTGGGRTLLPRQQTLRASIDWSFALLSEPEQLVLLRLSVFSDGFTLAAAEQVAAGAEVAAYDVLDLVTQLVDKSLVLTEPREEVRYRMLEGVRQYAQERLADSGDGADVRDRHLAYYQSMCRTAQQGLEGPELPQWVARLKADRANLNAAFDWASERDDGSAMWAMCGALTFHWMSDGQFSEGRRWFEDCRSHAEVPPAEQLAAKCGAAHLALYAGKYDDGIALASDALDSARHEGNDRFAARAMSSLAGLEAYVAPAAAAVTLHTASEMALGAGDIWCACDATQAAAYCHALLDQHDRAFEDLDAALPLARRLDNTQMLAWDLIGRGWLLLRLGDLAAARRSLESGRRHVERTGDPSILGVAIAIQTAAEVFAGKANEWKPVLDRTIERCGVVGAGVVPVLAAASLTVALALDDLDSAEEIIDHYEDLITALVPVEGSRFMQAAALAALRTADLDRARTRADRAVDLAITVGNRVDEASAHTVLAIVDLIESSFTDAEEHLHHALPLVADRPLPAELIEVLTVLGAVFAACGHLAPATRLWDAADAEAERLGILYRRVEPVIETYRAGLADQLSLEPRASDIDGRTLPLTEAVSYARRARGERKRPSTGWDSLTPTETQVVGLVAEGLSNPKVGERLFISPGTVKTHLAHIYAKLGIANRTELATAHSQRTNTTPTA